MTSLPAWQRCKCSPWSPALLPRVIWYQYAPMIDRFHSLIKLLCPDKYLPPVLIHKTRIDWKSCISIICWPHFHAMSVSFRHYVVVPSKFRGDILYLALMGKQFPWQPPNFTSRMKGTPSLSIKHIPLCSECNPFECRAQIRSVGQMRNRSIFSKNTLKSPNPNKPHINLKLSGLPITPPPRPSKSRPHVETAVLLQAYPML